MKNKIFDRLTVLALFITLSGFASAQTQTNAAPAPKLPPPILDNDEMAKLTAVRNQVLAAHPELKAEEKKLKNLHEVLQTQRPVPTADERNAAFEEWKAYQKTIREDALAIDPTLKPIFEKIDASRKKNPAETPFQPATK